MGLPAFPALSSPLLDLVSPAQGRAIAGLMARALTRALLLISSDTQPGVAGRTLLRARAPANDCIWVAILR